MNPAVSKKHVCEMLDNPEFKALIEYGNQIIQNAKDEHFADENLDPVKRDRSFQRALNFQEFWDKIKGKLANAK
jgi:hypothetical protein